MALPFKWYPKGWQISNILNWKHISMVKPKWILQLCWKCSYSGLHMTLDVGIPNFGTFLGASQCLYPEGQSQQNWEKIAAHQVLPEKREYLQHHDPVKALQYPDAHWLLPCEELHTPPPHHIHTSLEYWWSAARSTSTLGREDLICQYKAQTLVLLLDLCSKNVQLCE
jgi:hypothetical protein